MRGGLRGAIVPGAMRGITGAMSCESRPGVITGASSCERCLIGVRGANSCERMVDSWSIRALHQIRESALGLAGRQNVAWLQGSCL